MFGHFISNFFLLHYCSESLNRLSGSLHLNIHLREGSFWVLCEMVSKQLCIQPGRSGEWSPESKSCPCLAKTHLQLLCNQNSAIMYMEIILQINKVWNQLWEGRNGGWHCPMSQHLHCTWLTGGPSEWRDWNSQHSKDGNSPWVCL